MVARPDKKSARDIKVPSVISPSKAAREAAAAEKTKKPISTVVTDDTGTGSMSTDMVPASSSVVNDTRDHELRIHIGGCELVLGKFGDVYIKVNDAGNPCLILVGTRAANLFLRKVAKKRGVLLTEKELKEINEYLKAHAELELKPVEIYSRVAPYQNGIEIDLGDDAHTVIRITPGRVETVSEGSETLFYRTIVALPFAKPAKKGNLKKLLKYLKNIEAPLQILLIGWISYTVAHPKVSTTNYVILALNGGQGTGKSFLCRLLARLIDPSQVGLQIMPKNRKDLVIAAKYAHVLFYDNIRYLSEDMSDAICVGTGGGAQSQRELYTNDGQYVSYLHIAFVLNGIYDFITQSDLAQRSLTIHLRDMDESDRLSEKDLEAQLEEDLPEILQGLFELIADILKCLPVAEVRYPERMIDFSRWLAAMELVDGVPAGVYQINYSDCLKEAQLTSLLENTFAAAVIQFSESLDNVWRGRPSDLLRELNDRANASAKRSPDWPKSAESLSKRLRVLRTAMKSQGVLIEFTRGKHRQIEIITAELERELY